MGKVQGPRVPGKKNKNNFPVTVGETFDRVCAVNCKKMRLAAGLCPDPLGSYSAPLALQRGGEGEKGKRRVGNEEGGQR